MSKKILSVVIILTLLSPLYVFAEETVTPSTNTSPKSDSNEKLPTKQYLQRPLKDQNNRPIPLSSTDTKESVKMLLEKRKTANEENRLELKEKLQVIKDERKQELVLKIEEKITNINSRRTENMSEAITKLQTILNSIKGKTTALKTNGTNTASVDTAITEAETALAKASTDVQAQAQKSYTITVTDETTLKQNVGSTIKQLTEDLRNTYKSVIAAKQAVQKAARELKKVWHDVKLTPTITTTAIPTMTITSTP